MSLYDYQVSKELAIEDPPFAALIMAAYRLADTTNVIRLQRIFPDICQELQDRYNAPGGLLPSERVSP